MSLTAPALSTNPINLSGKKLDRVDATYSWHIPINLKFLSLVI